MRTKLFLLALLTISFLSCKEKKTDNKLTSNEKNEGWKLLFNGENLAGWHPYNSSNMAELAWRVEKGELIYSADSLNKEHEDLVTDESFKNYDLRFEWKIGNEGNSGVFINVIENDSIPTAWASGPEYQLLDINHPDYANDPTKRPGCLYGFLEQVEDVKPFENGEWNQSRIVQNEGKIEFYLNGKLTAKADLSGEEWKKRVKESKFSYFPNFGKVNEGKIALQKWYGNVWFKNIKIKNL